MTDSEYLLKRDNKFCEEAAELIQRWESASLSHKGKSLLAEFKRLHRKFLEPESGTPHRAQLMDAELLVKTVSDDRFAALWAIGHPGQALAPDVQYLRRAVQLVLDNPTSMEPKDRQTLYYFLTIPRGMSFYTATFHTEIAAISQAVGRIARAIQNKGLAE